MQSIRNQLSLDYPSAELPSDSNTKKKLLNQLRTIKKQISNELEDLPRKRQDWTFQKHDMSWNPTHDFFGSNPLSLVRRELKDKTSFSYLEKQKEDYLFCIKSDGTRYLWIVMKSGAQFFFSRSSQMFVSNVEMPPYFFKSKNCDMMLVRSIMEEEEVAQARLKKVKMEVEGGMVHVPGKVGSLDSLKIRKIQTSDNTGVGFGDKY